MTSGSHSPRGIRGLLFPYPITTAVLFTIIGAFPLFLTSAYAVRLQDEFNFGSAQLGYAVAAYFILGTIGANRLGPWVDRFGASLGLRVASLHSLVAALLIAFVATSWQWIAVALAISGFGNAIANLSNNRLVAFRAGQSKQGIAFGAKQAGIPMGSLLAGFLVSSFTSVDYVTMFTGFAVVAGVMALIVPKGNHSASRTASVQRGVGESFTQLFVLAIGGAFAGATGNSLAIFVVDAFDQVGFSESAAATILAVGSGAAIASRLTVGKIVDRRNSDGYDELTILMVAGAVGFVVAASAGSNSTILILGIVAAFAAAWGWPAVIYHTAVQNSDVPPATATGFVLTGVFTGTILGPPTLGLMADSIGFRWSWALSAVLIGLGAAFVATSRVIGRRRTAKS